VLGCNSERNSLQVGLVVGEHRVCFVTGKYVTASVAATCQLGCLQQEQHYTRRFITSRALFCCLNFVTMTDPLNSDDQLEWLVEERAPEDVENLEDYGTDTSQDSDTSDEESEQPAPRPLDETSNEDDGAIQSNDSCGKPRLRETTKAHVTMVNHSFSLLYII